MLKLRELFAGLSGRNGVDSEQKIRAAIAKVESETTSARDELASIADQRTEALLNDDDATLDKLDRRAEALHRSLERCDFALPELEKRLQVSVSRSEEARSKARHEAARKLVQEAEQRLLTEYDAAARKIVELIGLAASASIAAREANESLPTGLAPIDIPETLSRSRRALEERVIDEQQQQLWAYELTNVPVPEQSLVALSPDGRHGSHMVTKARCVFRTFKVQTVQLREGPTRDKGLAELIKLPSLFIGCPPWWEATEFADTDLAQRRAQESLAIERADGPVEPSRRVETRYVLVDDSSTRAA